MFFSLALAVADLESVAVELIESGATIKVHILGDGRKAVSVESPHCRGLWLLLVEHNE